MPQKCRVCFHPERSKIEALILVGRDGLEKIGKEHGISEKSVRHHKFTCMGLPRDHGKPRPVPPTVVEQIQKRVETVHQKNIYDELDELDKEALEVLRRNKVKNDNLVLKAVTTSKGVKEAKRDTAIAQRAIEESSEGLIININLVGASDND